MYSPTDFFVKARSHEQPNHSDSVAEGMRNRSNQRFTLNMFKIWQPIASCGDSDRRFEQEVAGIWRDNLKYIHEVNSFQIFCNKKLMLEIQDVSCLPRNTYL